MWFVTNITNCFKCEVIDLVPLKSASYLENLQNDLCVVLLD